MSTVFVTGGSGFVGRNLIRALGERGHAVRALARSRSSFETLRGLGAEPVTGDLDDVSALTRGMTGCDVAYHAAAKVDEWGDPRDFERVNVGGTDNVLAAARRAGLRRVVHVSTEAVLVDGTPLVNVDESRPLPASPLPRYPATKARAEARVVAANGSGLETVVVRPRLIWGADDTSLLPQIAAAVRQGRFMWIAGGRHRTSTCHVRNVAEGLLAAAERGRPGETYFVSDGEPVELRGFLGALLRSQGVTPPERELGHGLALALATGCEAVWDGLRLYRRPPPITRLAVRLIGEEVTVSDAKARRELGYVGHVSRERGLAELRG